MAFCLMTIYACEDWYFLIEAIVKGGVLQEVSWKFSSIYRMHDNNMSSNPLDGSCNYTARIICADDAIGLNKKRI